MITLEGAAPRAVYEGEVGPNIVGSVEWQPELGGEIDPIRIPFVADRAAFEADQDPRLLVSMGFGDNFESRDRRRAGHRVVRNLGEAGLRGVVAFSLPYFEVNGADQLEAMLKDGTNAVAIAFGAEEHAVDGFHISRGGASILAAAQAPELWGDITCGSPSGPTNDRLGKTPMRRNLNLIWNFGVMNLLQKPDRGLNQSVAGLVGELKQYSLRGVFTGLKYALSPELADESAEALDILLDGDHGEREVSMFVNGADPLYKTKDYRQFFKKLGRHEEILQVLPGLRHPGVLTRAGRKQQKAMAEWLVGVREERAMAQGVRDAVGRTAIRLAGIPRPSAEREAVPVRELTPLRRRLVAATVAAAACLALTVESPNIMPPKAPPAAVNIGPSISDPNSNLPISHPQLRPTRSLRVHFTERTERIGKYNPKTGAGTVYETVKSYAHKVLGYSPTLRQLNKAVGIALADNHVGGRHAKPRERWQAARSLRAGFPVLLKPEYFPAHSFDDSAT